jgi:predicted nucleic acid-binding protein
MRKVISNTTPLISLLKIDKLDLLRDLYGVVSIPQAVFLEIEAGKEKPYYRNLREIDWIKIEVIRNVESRTYFFDLDDGEAEVLILAKEQNADLVILDEIMGRRYAQQLDFNITGTVGILLKSKEKGLIYSLGSLLKELAEKGTWLNPNLISKALQLAGETK